MINNDTYGPRPDISGHHPGLRAKFLVSQAIWSPQEPHRALLEQKFTIKCCVYDQYHVK